MPAPAPVSSAAIDRENPWPGLASFTEDARGYFFGRTRETDELARLVRRETLTVLFGQSGLGKSSLLQAGLFPLLRESDHLPLYLRLDHAADAPPLAEQVKSALADAFAAVRADAPPIGPDETLWEYFHRKDVDIWSAKNRLLTPVLAFDQFEEIFTLGRVDEPRRARSRAFLSELAGLVENRAPAPLREKFDRAEADPTRYNFDKPSCRVILSLREDFLPDLEGLKQELPALVHNRLRLKRLDGTQALDAVARPAPDLLADGVGERIVEFVSGARGGSAERLAEMEVEPALLSVICRELNERRRRLAQPQITADLVSGNRREILTDFYERSVADLPDPMRRFVEDRLLTKSGFRDNLALETALEEPGVTRPLIDTLVARRLLRIEDRLGTQRVELTHDVLADIVRASRDHRKQRLADVETARRTRRLRLTVTGLAVTIAVVTVAALTGLRAQREAAAQERRRAAQEASRTDQILASSLLADGKTADGLAYLVRAAQRDPESQVIAPRILSVLTSRNFMLPSGDPLRLPSPARARELAADDNTLLVACDDDTIRVIDLAAWKVVHEFKFDRPLAPKLWAVATHAPRLVVGFRDGSFQSVDLSTRQVLAARFAATEPALNNIVKVRLSPDGRWFVAGELNRAALWETTTGKQIAALPVISGHFSFSPDSRLLAGSVQPQSNRTATQVQLWNCNDGSPASVPIGRDGAPLRWVEFAPDGRLGIGKQRSAAVYSIPDGQADAARLPGMSNTARFPSDGWHVVSIEEQDLHVTEVKTGKPAFPPLRHESQVTSFTFARGGSLIVSSAVDGVPRVWDRETGVLLTESIRRHENSADTIVSRDGRHLITFALDGGVHRHALDRGAAEPLILPRRHRVETHAFLPDQPHTLLRFSNGTQAVLVDVADGSESPSGMVYPRVVDLSSSSTLGGLFAPDMRSLVVRRAGVDTHALWSPLRHGEPIREIRLPSVWSALSSRIVSFHPSGDFVAVSGEWKGRVYDSKTGEVVWSMDPPTGPERLQFSPTGERMGYLVADGSLVVRRFPANETQTMVAPPTGRKFTSWQFSRDGRDVVAIDDSGGLLLADAATGRPNATVQAHRAAGVRLELSPDGKMILSIAADGPARVWASASLSPIGRPLHHTAAVSSGVFSPDNQRIITATKAGQIHVWDTASGALVAEPQLHPGDFSHTAVQVSPDGRFILSGRPYTEHRVWPMPPTSVSGVPIWLVQLATLVANRTVADSGELAETIAESTAWDALRREIEALPASELTTWANWFLSPAQDRPPAPGLTASRQQAQRARDQAERIQRLAMLSFKASELSGSGANHEIVATLREMVALAEQTNTSPRGLAGFRNRLANALLQVGSYAEAEAQLHLVLRYYEELASTESAIQVAVSGYRMEVGRAIAGQGRSEEAAAVLIEALEEIFDQHLPAGNISKANMTSVRAGLTALVQALTALDRREEAAAWQARAAALPPP
jgi:WD40 repeat protein